MKKSITIRIPEPCQEDWAKMSTTEKGKFCSVCTKEVFDFTSKTDEDLVKILSANKNACGRLKKSQLNRAVKLERKSGFSLAPLAASMLLPLSIFSNNPKSSTDAKASKTMVSMGIGRFSNVTERMQIVTEGVVTDENGNLLRNVEIISNETQTREWTNKNGEYRIVTLDKERLHFTFENYLAQEVVLSNTSKTVNVVLQTETLPDSILVGKIAATPEKQIVKDSINTLVKGVVSDDTGLPLPGANVIIKGSSVGTQTDFDGNYEITTKPGDVLVYSYVGFETIEVTVSNHSNTLDVSLEVGDYLLGELIVVGGISWEDSQPSKDPDWYEKAKQAYKNTIKFRKLEKERKKAERRAKREK